MRKTSVSVSLGLYDVSAQIDATYSSNNVQDFVDLSRFNREGPVNPSKVSTLETDFFWLDGTFELFPDNTSSINNIYWSRTMSNNEGKFKLGKPWKEIDALGYPWKKIEFPYWKSWREIDALGLDWGKIHELGKTWAEIKGPQTTWEDVGLSDYPTLTIDFTEDHSSIGLSFTFYEPTNDFVTSMTIYWYDSYGAQISAAQFNPTTVNFVANNPVQNYRKIRITFEETSKPHRYIKLTNIVFGNALEFGEAEIISAHLLEEQNPISSEVRVNTFDVTVFSETYDFSPLNPRGSFVYLQERQPLDVFGYIHGEQKYMGTFYVNNWENAKDNSLTLKAIDLIGVASQTTYYGDMYSNIIASTIVRRIADSAGLSIELDPGFNSVQLSGHLGVMSHKDALQQVAFALGAVLTCSRGDAIRIEPAPELPSISIPKSRKFAGGAVRLKEVVTAVLITSHNYGYGTERTNLLNDYREAGEHRIIFSSPTHSLIAEQGCSIVESNVNYAIISVPRDGDVLLTGVAYIDSQTIITKSSGLPSTVSPNEVHIEGATLISNLNADDIATRAFDYYQRRIENEFRMIPIEETSGSYVIADSLRSEKLRGQIESMNIDLAGGFLASVKLVGNRIEVFEGYYAGEEIYTGEEVGVI